MLLARESDSLAHRDWRILNSRRVKAMNGFNSANANRTALPSRAEQKQECGASKKSKRRNQRQLNGAAHNGDAEQGRISSPKAFKSTSMGHDWTLPEAEPLSGRSLPASSGDRKMPSVGDAGHEDLDHQCAPESRGPLAETPVSGIYGNSVYRQMGSAPIRAGEKLAILRAQEHMWEPHQTVVVLPPPMRWGYNVSSFHIRITPFFGRQMAGASPFSLEQPHSRSASHCDSSRFASVASPSLYDSICLHGGIHSIASNRSPDGAIPGDKATRDDDLMCQHFCLRALWTSLEEASIFGIEVPSIDDDAVCSQVVYIPYLSALCLSAKPDAETQPNPSAAPEVPKGTLSLHYVDTRPPYMRHPLTETVEQLRTGYTPNEGGPAQNYSEAQRKLVDANTKMLEEDSWMAIYWQPVQTKIQQSSESGAAPIFLVCYSLAGVAVPKKLIQQQWSPSECQDKFAASYADHLPALWTGRASTLRKRIEDQTIDYNKRCPLMVSLPDEPRLITFATVPCHANPSLWTIGSEDDYLDDALSPFEENNEWLQDWLQQKNITLPDLDWITRGQMKTKRLTAPALRRQPRR